MTDSSPRPEPNDAQPEGEQPSTEADEILEGKSGEPFAPNDQRSS